MDVLKCPNCGMYYNATGFQHCPHCEKKGKKIAQTSSEPVEKPVKKGFFGFGSKNKADAVYDNVQRTQNDIVKDNGEPVFADINKTIDDSALEFGVSGKKNAEVETAEVQQEIVNDIPALTPEPQQVMAETYQEDVIPQQKQEEPQPQVQTQTSSQNASLTSRFGNIAKTTAKYVSRSGSEVSYPVVGWLICVKGVYYGKSFQLRAGRNHVGRNSEFEVALINDTSVSSKSVLSIIYDTKGNVFNAVPGDSSSLCYINGDAMYERVQLKGFEEIELGDSEQNKFLFVPFCGENFQWSKYPVENEEK